MSENWKSPGTIIGIATLLLSICGNVYQYSKLKTEKAKSEAEILLLMEQVSLSNTQKLQLQQKAEKNKELSEGVKKEISKIDETVIYLKEKINRMVASEVKYGDEDKWIGVFFHEIDSLYEEKLKRQIFLNTINSNN